MHLHKSVGVFLENKGKKRYNLTAYSTRHTSGEEDGPYYDNPHWKPPTPGGTYDAADYSKRYLKQAPLFETAATLGVRVNLSNKKLMGKPLKHANDTDKEARAAWLARCKEVRHHVKVSEKVGLFGPMLEEAQGENYYYFADVFDGLLPLFSEDDVTMTAQYKVLARMFVQSRRYSSKVNRYSPEKFAAWILQAIKSNSYKLRLALGVIKPVVKA